MKIYFTCSTAQFIKHKDSYLEIRQTIVDLGHTLTRDWIPTAIKRIESGGKRVPDYPTVYKACIKALNQADLVIIDDTVSNFSTGHQITLAIQKRKPTLVLWGQEKHEHFTNTFLSAMESEYLDVVKYTDGDVQGHIRAFINKYQNARETHRFNLVLSEAEKQYIEWAKLQYGESQTQVIRKSLRQKMREDNTYNSYLQMD